MKSFTSPDSYRWLILATAVLAVTGALGFGRFSYAMLLSPMSRDLGLTTIQAGDLATGNMLGYLGCSVVVGIVAGTVGPKMTISFSLLLTSIAICATGFSNTYTSALITRIVAGASSAGVNITVMGLLSTWFSSKKRGLAGGIAVSGTSVGLIVSGIVIPLFIRRFDVLGWRYSWFMLSGLTFLFSLVCFLILKNHPRELSVKVKRKAIEIKEVANVAKHRQVLFTAGIYILFGFSYIIYATFFSEHLIIKHGFSISEAGKLWSLIGIGSLASGFIWGVFSDRVGRKYGLGMVLFLQSCSFFLFGVAGSLWGIYVSVVLFALTAWSIPAIVAAAAGDFVGPDLAPAAFGFLSAVFGIGQVLGPFVGARLAAGAGDYTQGLLAASAAALTGAVLSLLLKSNRPADRTSPEG